MRLLWGVLVLALLMGSVRAQEEEPFPIEPGKINANDTGVLEPGQVEIQPGWSGFFSTRGYDANGVSLPDSDVRQDQSFTQCTFGVVPDFDVNVLVGYAASYDSEAGVDPVTGNNFFQSGRGLSDLTLGTRWRFFQDEEARFALAYITYTTLPTAQHGSDQALSLSQEVATLQHRLAIQKDVGHWSLLADLGCLHSLASNGPGFEGGLSMQLAAGYQVTEEWQPLVEVAYNSAFYANDPYSDSWTVTGGGTYYVSPDVRLNLGLTQTIAGHNSRDGLTATFFVTIVR